MITSIDFILKNTKKHNNSIVISQLNDKSNEIVTVNMIRESIPVMKDYDLLINHDSSIRLSRNGLKAEKIGFKKYLKTLKKKPNYLGWMSFISIIVFGVLPYTKLDSYIKKINGSTVPVNQIDSLIVESDFVEDENRSQLNAADYQSDSLTDMNYKLKESKTHKLE